MERSDIHAQIKELADKINHLNDNLTASKKIHPVEIDLLGLYCRELIKLTEELPKATQAAIPDVPKTENVGFKPVEVSIPEIAVKSADKMADQARPVAAPPVEQEAVQPLETKHEEPRPRPSEPQPRREEPRTTDMFKDMSKVLHSMEENAHEPVIRPPQPYKKEEEKSPEVSFEMPVVEAEKPQPIPPRPEPTPPAPDPFPKTPEPQPITPEPMPDPVHPEPIPQTPAPQPDPVKPEPTPPAPEPTPPLPDPVPEVPGPTTPEPPQQPVYEQGIPRRGISFTEPVTSKAKTDEPASLNDRFAPPSALADILKKNSETRKLREMMDLGEKFMFVKELFGGDADLFDRSLRHIDQLPSLDDAQKFLDTEIKTRNSWVGKELMENHFLKLLEEKFKVIG